MCSCFPYEQREASVRGEYRQANNPVVNEL